MNVIAVIILAALLSERLLCLAADRLNLKVLRPGLPSAFREIYNARRYRKSQLYLRAQTRFDGFAAAVQLTIFLAFWFFKGFPFLDRWTRSFGAGEVITGLVYIGALSIMSAALSLPFSAYHTFVIEERFGFNRTTWETFLRDRAKGLALGVAVGAPLLAGILFLFNRFGADLWWGCWAAVTAYLLALQYIVPTWIMPLFNKFEPLEDGELKKAVLAYARLIGFPLQKVLVMDGSRRSDRSNAFFTGFGRHKRIVLFDTLVARHTVPELVAVLAHEMGHYKKHHILASTLMGIGQSGLMLFLFSKFISNPLLFEAFYMDRISVHGGLIFFAMLYSPIEFALGILTQALSRRNEYAADRFAAETIGDFRPLADALKKLAAHNLSNLFPHPLYVILNYSHPPPIPRLAALERGPRS